MKEIKSQSELKIDGLAELAAEFPDGEWRRLSIYIRKDGDKAHVIYDRNLVTFDGAYIYDGGLWVRDCNDELQLLADAS